MTTRGLRLLTVIASLSSLTVVNAQIPRDGVSFSRGTAGISGVVLADEVTTRPLPRAIVSLAGSSLQPGRWVVTDDAGRFAFDTLPAGNLSLSAMKSGYLPTVYGQKNASPSSGVLLSLASGQQMDDLTLRLPRGAVVTGTITDDAGVPRRGVPVILQQRRLINGEMTLLDVSMVSSGQQGLPVTDDRGVYRAFGLPPGDYVISASLPGASDLGVGLDLRQPTAEEVQWATAQLRVPGASRAGGLSASPQNAPSPTRGRSLAAVPVYFPGTSDPSGAMSVSVRSGEERSGVDFAVGFVPATRITGTVMGPDGHPAAGAQVIVTPARGLVGARIAGRGATRTDDAGAFTIGSIPPGGSTISVRSAGRGGAPARANAAGGNLWAETQITAGGEDINNVMLTLRPGITISGRVVFDADPAVVLPDLATARVTLNAMSTVGIAPVTSQPARVRADGTFEIPDVVPGRYRLSATVQPTPGATGTPGWTVKTAMIAGRDARDVPFDVTAAGDVGLAVVTLSNRSAEISGKLLDAAGRPTTDYFVVVFSTDRSYWLQGSRRVVAPLRPSSDGAYRVGGLVPGSYYFAALTDVDPEDMFDREFLEQVAAAAITITLADGEKRVQDLKLAGR